ncbi:monovalent cation/H+ antiporter complex subunit F [Corynebacterium heidelbergense]|uniref:Cation:proton antiporter n=1 Tax=Corynebacterium heidelbergense TaxID=2055947 RepID=A0A364VAZ7_9CORY|nr:monovalent cation/H+ antiporter complex subunit F [Corynebacterium heidelbergense]RAV33825.1 cation:proton antiporter [Corynebacterium heidelbergense]WCZ37496.1 putative monovalent cation/H+ antiporter subunit F [Corynebacterium heidelbergense]
MNPEGLLSAAASIAAVVIVVALLMLMWRTVSTHNDARRAVCSDMIFMTVAALFLLHSLFFRSAITFEVALIAGLLGPLSTIAYARIITRGRR